MKVKACLLGVNIDHVATLRQARFTCYPDPLEAMFAAERGGADGITLHLREDRRHIQEYDVEAINKSTRTRLNLEMAVTDKMVQYALHIKPAHCCLVPEKREELTTEGGLDIVSQEKKIAEAVLLLAAENIDVSLFIDPDLNQIQAAVRCGAPTIEIHTGGYADATTDDERVLEYERIKQAAAFARQAGLVVNAGHGLNEQNVIPIARLPEINELNIGHAIVAKAIYVGMEQAVRDMKHLLYKARENGYNE